MDQILNEGFVWGALEEKNTATGVEQMFIKSWFVHSIIMGMNLKLHRFKLPKPSEDVL